MSAKINSTNLDAHYTTETTVKPRPFANSGPKVLTSQFVYSDSEANKKIANLNEDVYQKVEENKKKGGKTFAIVFSGLIATILAIISLKNIFKKF